MEKFIYLFLIFIIMSCKNQETEKELIVKLLEKESKTWRDGNVQEHANCWYIQPYSKIIISTIDGKLIDVEPKNMINPPPNSIGQGGYSINSNYNFSINGNYAWVGHNEKSVSIDSVITYSYEIRMLEKINNEWKIVGQSIHIFNPNL